MRIAMEIMDVAYSGLYDATKVECLLKTNPTMHVSCLKLRKDSCELLVGREV